MCRLHHTLFDRHEFFIRFFPNVSHIVRFVPIIHMKQANKFVLIDYSDEYDEDIHPYHGKAIALDISDRYAPFASLSIIHEMRVRGYHPFHDTTPELPDTIDLQGWITTRGVLDNTESHFLKHIPGSGPGLPQMPSMTGGWPTSEGAGPSTSGTQTLELNEKVIADILAATLASPSWKACVIEGTSRTGSAEENKQKYLSILQGS